MSAIALLIVTALSATLAVVMSVIAWRVAREERRREELRISALAAEIHSPSGDGLDPMPAAAPPARAPVTQRPVIGIRDEPSRRPVAAIAAWPPPHRAAAVVHDLPLRDAPMAAGSSTHLFERAASETPAGFRPASVVALCVFVVGAAVALLLSAGTGPRTAPVGPLPAAAPEHATADAWPLELVALSHERDGDQLTVRGLVRNPMSGQSVDRLTAVVFVFNHDGGFVTSARATVARSELEPGRESAFVVAVPNAGAIRRYRVSFRTDDRVVPHLDKREPGAMARVQ